MLAFRAGTTPIAAALAAIASPASAPAPPTLSAEIAFAPRLAAVVAALRMGARTGFTALTLLLVTRPAIITAIAALTTAATTTTAMTAMALIRITTIFAARGAALRGSGCLGLGSEKPFQPADETDGFFLRLGTRRAFRLRLIGAGLKLAFVAPWLARLEAARFPGIARVTWLPGLVRTTLALIAAAFAAVAGLESPAFIRPLRRLARSA